MPSIRKDESKAKPIPNPSPPQACGALSSELPSSHGISPREMTPKDITPEDATWKDLKVRNISSGEAGQREELLLDEAIELTFPASDPTAELAASAESEKAALCHDSEEDLLDEAIELTFPASDPIAVTPHHRLRHAHSPLPIV